MNDGMGLRDQYQRLIERKRNEADQLRAQLTAAEGYIAAMQDAIRLLPRDGQPEEAAPQLREGSKLARVKTLLATNGKPMHINQILEGIGDAQDMKSRVSLTGSLSQYAKNGKIFKKLGPNEFGLLEYPPGVTFESFARANIETNSGVADRTEEEVSDDIPF